MEVLARNLEVNRGTLYGWFSARPALLGSTHRGATKLAKRLNFPTVTRLANDIDDAVRARSLNIASDDDAIAAVHEASTISQMSLALAGLPYTYSTTSKLRKEIPSERLPTLCSALVDVFGNDGRIHPNNVRPAGIMATILSTRFRDWSTHPSRDAETKKLKQCCERGLADGDVSKIALLEPLVFSLAAYDRDLFTDLHQRFLRVCVEDVAWNTATVRRYRHYYASRRVQLQAIKRHIDDRSDERGLLVANDLPHVVAAGKADADDLTHSQRARAAGLLESMLSHLRARGVREVVDTVTREHAVQGRRRS